jgi:dTDP-4-amino-4,6-dideoxygalactose transaminase
LQQKRDYPGMMENIRDRPEPPVFASALEIVRPTFPPMDGVMAEFSRCLAAGQVTNNGRWVVEFEHQLTAYLGVPTIVFSSGQTALMTMLRAAGIAGGEVIVPAFTFLATAHAASWCGAEIVFADIKEDRSFTIDPADVERRITGRTVAILAVDPYGIACDTARLSEIAKRHHLKLLYDSAPAFGTRIDGRLTGGFGDAQIFSFHATKAFNTMEGGCLSSNDAELIDRARAIRNFGQTADEHSALVGLNGKMTEICALIGIEQLKGFEAAACIRRRSVARIAQGLETIAGLNVARAPAGQEPIWLYLPVEIDPAKFGCDRERAAELLARENLHVRKYYSPACHTMMPYARGGPHPSLPTAERVAANVLALPIYNDMTVGECDGVVAAFRKIAKEAKL